MYSGVLVRSITKCFPQFVVKKINPHRAQHISDEMQHRLSTKPHLPTSVPSLTDALEVEWEQITAARLQKIELV